MGDKDIDKKTASIGDNEGKPATPEKANETAEPKDFTLGKPKVDEEAASEDMYDGPCTT